VFQAAFAILVTVLSGFTQFLKYKKTDSSKFLATTITYLLVAILIAGVVVYATGIYHLKVVFIILMIGSVYSLLANGKILVDAFKGKFKLAGSAVAHIGFGLILVGALIAAGTSKVVSENKTGLQMGNGSDTTKANNPRENILVYRNEPVKMGNYLVNYVGDSISAPDHFYKILYQQLDNNGKVQQQFMLKPKVQVNKNMGGFTASPDTKHYLLHDLYTHITMTNSLSVNENQEGSEDHGQEDDSKNYDPPMARQVSAGDTIRFREGYIIFKGLSNEASVSNLQLGKNDAAIGADLEVVSHGKNYAVKPLYVIKENNVFGLAKKVDDVGLKVTLTKIIPETRKAEITIYQQPLGKRKFIVMRAIDFPYINFFWSGTIIMVIGFLMSIFRRNKELKTSNS
jgi:cytochrome c-type biogenesis protein CcmF